MLDRDALVGLVACPACKGLMQNLSVCQHCGVNYGEVDGLPALFPASATRREVNFEFSPVRSVPTVEFAKCFSYPARCGGAGSNYPYHLDLAHLDVINRLTKSHCKILEVGCGGAQMRKFVQSKGHQYIGTDVSKTRVFKHLQEFGGPDILCDAHFLPFADCAFDIIYSAAVTEHLACPYLVAQEVSRCLKPGGYYLGNVSFLEPWHDNSFFHMSPLGAFELLSQAKFDIVHIWPGKGYSGFRSIMVMGNWLTKRMTLVGDAVYFVYKFGNRVRNWVKPADSLRRISDDARVSGATDWIARKHEA